MTEEELLACIVAVLVGQTILIWLGFFFLDETLRKILRKLGG